MNKTKKVTEVPQKETGVLQKDEMLSIVEEGIAATVIGNKAFAENKPVDAMQSLTKVKDVLEKLKSFIQNME